MWPTATIGELCEMVKGQSPTMKTSPGDYPFVVTAEARRTSDSFQLVGPAVCLPLISSTGHGHASMHRVHYQEGDFALADLLVALLPKDPSQLDCKFLYWLLTAKKDDYFVPLMQGTANVSLKVQDIASVSIPVPNFPEQQRIVAKIERLTGSISNVRRVRQEASLESDLVLLSARRKAFAQLAAGTSVKLATVCTDIIDCLHSNPVYSDAGIPTIRSADIAWGRLLLEQARRTDEAEYQRRTRRGEPEAGDIIVVREGGGTGKAGLVLNGQKMSLGQRVLQIKPDQRKVMPEFFLHQWLSPAIQEKIAERTKGSASPHLNVGEVKRFDFLLPSINEQASIVCELNRLSALVEQVRTVQTQTTGALDALLPTILGLAFKGEL